LNNNIRRTLAALGIAAVAASAAPMVPVWLRADDPAARPAAPRLVEVTGRLDQSQQIVVDLADGASDADILDIERRENIDLQFNSVYAEDDRLMVADVPASRAGAILDALKRDGRVEAAEPQEFYSIPGNGLIPAAARQVHYYGGSASRYLPSGAALLDEGLGNDALSAARIQAAEDRAEQEARGVRFETMLPQDGEQTVASCESDEVPKATVLYVERSNWVQPVPVHVSLGISAADAAPSLASADYAGYDSGPHGTRPNDPRYDEQWNFQMVGAEEAWKHTRGKGVVVAVIDTGVAAKSTKRGKIARDFGSTTFTAGYDFVHNDKDPYDDHGHGTHVAGTIAESTNNGEGVAGWPTRRASCRSRSSPAQGYGTSSDIADAIRYAADNGANIINMSLGSNQPSDVIRKACQYARKKNVTIVCAAGNGFGEPVGYPAAFPECIAISSVGPSGNIATYSSYGKEVALAAPGGDMMESGDKRDGILQNTIITTRSGEKQDDYFPFQGTSMASPHAAAVAALVYSQGVTDPARIREVLTKTAAPKDDKNKYGAGILSASNATARAAAETAPKLRHLLFVGMGLLLLSAGGPIRRRNLGLRAGMALALGAGFFAPDWFSGWWARIPRGTCWASPRCCRSRPMRC
jgi:subtilisin family serine protease